MSLSLPRGPRVDARTEQMARQAAMFDSSWGVPCEVSVPSDGVTGLGQVCLFNVRTAGTSCGIGGDRGGEGAVQ